MIRKTRKNAPYYSICTPQEKNVGTGNVCFNVNDLAMFDKDFLFDQEVNGKMYNKVLPKEWVRDHMLPMFAYYKSNEETGRKGGVYPFYILKVDEILNY